MLRSMYFSGRVLRLGRWCCAVVILVCLGCGGCANLSPRNERYQYDRFYDWSKQSPGRDQRTQPVALTNKGRQIAGDLGVK